MKQRNARSQYFSGDNYVPAHNGPVITIRFVPNAYMGLKCRPCDVSVGLKYLFTQPTQV